MNPGDGLKASADFWYTGNYVANVTDYSTGATIQLNLAKGSTGVDGYFAVDCKGKITNNPLAVNNNQIHANLELMLGNTTAAGTDACDITVSDGISQT